MPKNLTEYHRWMPTSLHFSSSKGTPIPYLSEGEVALQFYIYLILKNYVTIPTISFYDMNAIQAS